MDFKEDMNPLKYTNNIHKQPFERKVNRKDGLILQIHHTLPGHSGEIRRTRFLRASFSASDDLLAVQDHRGSIFIVNLNKNEFWLLGKRESVSLLCLHPQRSEELLIGCEKNSLVLLNAESGFEVGHMSGHTEPPSQASFTSDGHFCLTVASCEGFIWDLRTFTQAHRLTLQPGMTIKLALFMPISNNILACFHDDAIHVWAFETFQSIKQFVPELWKGHNLNSVAFTRNGRAMVVGGASSHQLVVFVVDDWKTQNVIELPHSECGVRQLEFVPELFDSGANKVLGVLSNSGSLYFVDMSTGLHLNIDTQPNIRSFTCSKNGKYLACIMSSGEVKIYNTVGLLANKRVEVKSEYNVNAPNNTSGKGDSNFKGEANQISSEPIRTHHPPSRRHTNQHHLNSLTKQVEENLDVNRLQPILREFCAYPDQYRALIWRTILKLPGNREPWRSLAERPLHPVAVSLVNTYALENKIVLKCLQSVVSCLAYWSPVFAELSYLPLFLFPFVKVLHSDAFVCFEVAATVIINWCQHWFEYLTFPPVNVLGMTENILAEHDTGLLSVLCKAGITSRVYAWSLLSTAFSEVLSSKHWQQLWDHILSNPPWFILFAVVAYSICCRASLKTCSSLEDFQFFYSNQNPINMKHFLKKTYELMEKTSQENHPKQYLTVFTPLTKGNYPVFTAFPKFIVDYQKGHREAIQQEEENILCEQRNLLNQRLAREERRAREHNARVHQARLLDVEKAARAQLCAEEARLAKKRRELAALRQNLRLQEQDALEKTSLELVEQSSKLRSAELDRMLFQLNHKAEQADVNANEEIREQISKLHAQKEELRQCIQAQHLNQASKDLRESQYLSSNSLDFKKEHELLETEISKLRRDRQQSTTRDIRMRLAEVDCKQHEMEVEMARRAKQHQDILLAANQNKLKANAKSKVQELEKEVQNLMDQLEKTMEKRYVQQCELTEQVEETDSWRKPEGLGMYDNVESVRSRGFYLREQTAVNEGMDVRKQLLSDWDKR